MKTRKPLGIIDLVIMVLLIVGIAVLAYPFVSDAYVSHQNQQVIDRYQVKETAKNKAALHREYQRYQAKNRALAKANAAPGLAAFNTAVNDEGTAQTAAKRDQGKLTAATVARLTIPKIGVDLPVFDHTTDWLLQFGAALLDGTSYPTGGAGTRAVISAHRGVPNASLFTRLPELRSGDRFFIKIGDRTLAYRVFKRQVIAPEAVDQLRIVPGQDLVTLMTCTPYMVNSHRLLVTGRRVPYTAKDAQAAAATGRWNKLKLYAWGLGALALIGLMAWLLRGLAIGRTRYQLVLPAERVVVRRGRRRRVFEADANGVVTAALAGNRYHATAMRGARTDHYRVYVRRLRDRQFTLRQVKH